jgi:hypothetical protein
MLRARLLELRAREVSASIEPRRVGKDPPPSAALPSEIAVTLLVPDTTAQLTYNQELEQGVNVVQLPQLLSLA